MALYLTEEQTEFILEKFFKKEDIAGWRNIATKLIETGKCVVAGDNPIWYVGAGEFIVTSKIDGFFGCLEYTFDLEGLLKSSNFRITLKMELDVLSEQQKTLNEKIGHLANLNRFANK